MAVDIILYLLAKKGFFQQYKTRIVLFAFLYHHDVHIGGIRSLNDEGVLDGVKARFQGVVAVNGSGVHVPQNTGKMGGFKWLELEIARISGDIEGGGRQSGAFLKGNKPF